METAKRKFGIWGITVLAMFISEVNAKNALNQEMPLIEAIEQISEDYEVYFTFDKKLIPDIKVSYDKKENEDVEDAVSSILKETTLTYKLFNQQFLVIYKNDEEGLESLRKMSKYLERLIDDEEKAIFDQQKNTGNIKVDQRNGMFEDIVGTVVNEMGEPLIGVTILVKGTDNGTATDLDGNFRLEGVAKEDVLVVSYIGYITQEISVGDNSQITVSLLEDSTNLDEVVVTALGINKETRSLTYATQNVEGRELSKVKDLNYVNSLAGKVAGAVITRGTMGPGSSTRVLIRGNKSLTGNSSPLYVIDGVPSSIEFNPDDIESIQILPGASAAALYGSQAANGVVLITTKKGKKGASQINFSSSITFEEAIDLPKLQTSYGRTDPQYNDSWGEKVSNGSDRHIKEFFKTGTNFINSISFSQGNDVAQMYLSYSNSEAKGILPKNDLSQHTITLKLSSQFLNNRLSIDGSMNYLQRKIFNQNVIGGYSAITGIISFPIDDDWSKYSGNNFEVWDPVRQVNVQNWPYLRNEWQPSQNPYWVQNRNQTDDLTDKLISSFVAKYSISSWLYIQGRATYDFSTNHWEKRNYASTIGTVEGPNGGYGFTDSKNTGLYADLLLIGDKEINPHFKISSILGVSSRQDQNSGSAMSSTVQTSLLYPNFFSIYALNGLYNKSEYLTNSASRAVFGNATFNVKETLFVDITGRNEWSSTVSTPFFYPSAGLSYLLPDFGGKVLSFAKVRGSYSEVGNSLPFGISNPNPPYALGNNGNIVERGALPFFDGADTTQLKPERTRSFEFGMDLRFFNNKMNLNLTYYNARTSDQVFLIEAPAGSGAQNFWINGGEVDNRGIEGIITYQTSFGELEWTPSLNFSHNKNRILGLSDKLNADRFVLNSSPYGSIFLTRPKDGEYGSFGDVFGKKYLKDEGGQYITNEAGLPLVSDSEQFIGNSNPNFLLGLNNTFQYKRFLFSFLIDSRFGGHIANRTQVWLDYKGLSKETGDARDKGGVWVNDKLVSAQDYYLQQSGTGNSPVLSEYFYDATNIRMRELSLGYTWPQPISGLEQLSLSFIARNVFFIYKSAPFDPEVGVGASPSQEGFANYVLPSTRSLGLSLNVVLSGKN
jgi:TonB-linked SusC/RagA family outer membrane protein